MHLRDKPIGPCMCLTRHGFICLGLKSWTCLVQIVSLSFSTFFVKIHEDDTILVLLCVSKSSVLISCVILLRSLNSHVISHYF